MNRILTLALLVTLVSASRRAPPAVAQHKHIEYRFPFAWGVGYPLEVVPEEEIKQVKEVKAGTCVRVFRLAAILVVAVRFSPALKLTDIQVTQVHFPLTHS